MHSTILHWVDQNQEDCYSNHSWNPSHIFVDWITLKGEPRLHWPDIKGDERAREINGMRFCSYEPKKIPKPYATSFRLLSHDDKFLFTGNPSRIGRADNAWGFKWPEALARTKQLLAEQQLTQPKNLKLSRIDLTVMVETGGPKELHEYLAQLRLTSLRATQTVTTQYGSIAYQNSWKRIHVYDKAADIAKWPRLTKDKLSFSKSEHAHDLHLDRLQQEIYDRGIARIELKVKQRKLASLGLCNPDAITQSQLETLFMKETQPLKKVVLENGAQLTDTELGVLVKWMQGCFNKADYARNTYYKYRRNIVAATGYDISAPGPISLDRRRKITTRTTSGLDWYQLPKIVEGLEFK